jgi:hypothetical protein
VIPESELALLLAKQAIAETLYRYCRAMDRIDAAMTLSVWHPYATCNYGSAQGVPDMLFRDYLAGSTQARAGFANHSHQIANILIRPDGDRAVSEAYFTASLQTRPQDGMVTEHLWRGRYLDRWTRHDGKWLIAHRQVVFDSYTPHDFPAARLDGMPLSLGRRDADDPSYAHLGEGPG